MRLKQIELHGFKSFAKKTRIEFNNQFSVIVGPNGCGKSNIADAIRWVLGEQSAKSLRGSKMEDVVFAGTSEVKAMNYCKVAITFDNSDRSLNIDYDELEVSRTVYRTGESNYKINNTQVRLKDITELFMDTGLGKEGYSIISQGRIDEILSARPEERRILLDEAAGVSKYKYKRDESMKKLDNTMENLSRVDDIMKEVKRNRSYLKREADKAKKALELKRTLEEYELSTFINFEKDLSNKIKVLSSSLNDYSDKAKAEKNNLEESKDKLGQLQEAIEDQERYLNETKNSSSINNSKYSNLFTNSKIENQKIENFEKDLQRIHDELSNRTNKLTENKKQIEDLKAKQKALDGSIAESEANYSAEKELNESIITVLEDYSLKYKTILEDYVKYKKVYDDTLLSKRTKEDLTNTYKGELDYFLEEYNIKEGQLNETIEEMESVNSAISDLENLSNENMINRNSIKEKMNKIINEGNEIKDKISTEEKELNKLESEYNAFKNIQSNFEGYYKPVQRLLKEAEKNPSLRSRFINTLAEEISVKPSFEKAIEYALGSQVQNIITETTEDAKYLIKFLKENNIGRLTFLPLDRYRVKDRNFGQLKNEDFLDFAADVVVYDEKLKALIENLLARTIIVEDLDKATKISHKSNNRIVTLDGDIINTGGSIVGGSNKANKNHLINRNLELRNLKKSINDKKTYIESLSNELMELRERYSEVDKELNIINNVSEKNSTNLKSLYDKKNELDLNRKIAESQLKTLDNDIFERKNKIESFNEINEDEISNLLLDIESLEKEKADYEDSIRKKESEKQNSEIKLLNIKNKLESMNRDLLVYRNSITNHEADIQNGEDTVNRLNKEILYIEEELTKSKESYNKNSAELENLSKIIAQEKDIIDKTEKSLNASRKEINSLNSDILTLTQSINKLELQIEKINNNIYGYEEEIISKRSYILEEYNYTFDKLMDRLKTIEVKEVEEDKLKELKENYKSISNYNEEAIVEYETINDQYQFYINQKEDLIKSKEDVEEIIRVLENQIEEEFKISFKEINLRFDRIFSYLFSGGSAKLVIDQNDRLSAGVDIEVKLPGKNTQNLSLLSGGERALTAVSLLFAIFETNPAPFCILDEADAALDESNINKYIEYIKSFDEIQFIIITHRKTTMEIAQTIYGVTMEEDGISKVINLELEESISS